MTTSTGRRNATMAEAKKDFIADCRTRHLSDATVEKYEQVHSRANS
jgi:hypothetical protein